MKESSKNETAKQFALQIQSMASEIDLLQLLLSESNLRELARRNESEDLLHKCQQLELEKNNILI